MEEKLRRVYSLAWDGEPSMSGKPHRASIGAEFDSLVMAQAARDRVPSMKSKPGLRIESRLVSEWELVASASALGVDDV